jgi:hypothetical protein
LDALSPTAAKGSIIVRNASHNVALAAGVSNGMSLLIDGTTNTGLRWGAVDLANADAVTGVLPLARGGLGVGSLGQDGIIISDTTGVREVKYNFNATVNPTVNDDVDGDYEVGSRWYNITDAVEFVCLSNTNGAAVWVSTTYAGIMGVRVVSTAVNYTVAAGVNVVQVTATGKTITLSPGASYAGAVITVKDLTGNANPAIIVDGNISNIDDGGTTYTISVPYGALTVYWTGTQWRRLIVRGRPATFAEGGTGTAVFPDQWGDGGGGGHCSFESPLRIAARFRGGWADEPQ